MKYLLVDDDAVFRGRLARSLSSRGLSVLEAGGLNDVRNLLKSEVPDRAVIDLKLKGEWGLTVLKELIDSGCKEALILSGYGSIPSAVEALKLGAVNFLAKPVTADELIDGFSGKTKINNAPTLEEYEWEYILRVLNDNNGNVTSTARVLGVHRQALQRKLRTKHF